MEGEMTADLIGHRLPDFLLNVLELVELGEILVPCPGQVSHQAHV